VLFFSFSAADVSAGKGDIHVIEVAEAISPGAADFIKRSIKEASETEAACIIIEMDTPGGFFQATREIVMAIMASRVPVVVHVTPSGARAASAGVLITIAADIAVMAPGTNIGAAHPVNAMGGKDIEGDMSTKVINDMVANARSIAEKRGRNADWVEKAIRESASVTETEALEKNVIDLIAGSRQELIRKIDGRQIKDKGTLNVAQAEIKVVKETFRTKILKFISDPTIAFVLVMIALAGLYFEFSHPGAIFPGVVGGIALILAGFAFQVLPVNYAGVLLIILAFIFFIMEIKITSYGLLSVAGVISLMLGAIMLFKGDNSDMQVSWSVLIPILVAVSAFFVAVAALAFKAQKAKPQTGTQGIVGEIGVVKQAIDPEGKVFVHGELWNATSKVAIAADTKVRIVSVEKLLLEVEPLE
jgi:membrane-bound serine protease (ClpP class)